ncbi:XisH family protein [Prochlorothrix hollandica]|uniref:XisH family protein n=1 Tax=Prochlorothrix hollandica TaxID=1223 RepID=UPI00334113FA
MMAKDIIHHRVRTALEKDGWEITDDPLYLNVAEIEVYIDLGAERLLGAEKGDRKIAVEIKTFLNPSALSEFHTVLGQCLNYRLALKLEGSDRTLYLAIPQEAWSTFFRREFAKLAIAEHQLQLIIIDLAQEEIIEWSP